MSNSNRTGQPEPLDLEAAEMHDNAEREAILAGRSFSQTYIPIPGMWTAINW